MYLDVAGFFDGGDDLNLIGQLTVTDGGDHDVHKLDGLNQAVVIVKITMDDLHSQRLELVDGLGLGGVRQRRLSHQSEALVAGLCARLHYELPYVSCPSDEQNLALRRHDPRKWTVVMRWLVGAE